MKSLKFLVFGGAVTLFGFAARQASVPAALQRDFDRLQAANTLHVTLKLRVIGDAPDEYTIALAKPNKYKVVGPNGTVESDGTKKVTYNKDKNTYYEEDASDADLAALLKKPEMVAWAPFFVKTPDAIVAAAKQTGSRTIEGHMANEIEWVGKQLGVKGTLYLDRVTGVARGYEVVIGEKDYLANAGEAKLSTDAPSAEEFAFIAPDGAKKTDAPKPDAPTYTNVQAILNTQCMPCHSAQRRAGGYDLSTYQGVKASVTPGNGAGSPLVTVLRQAGPGRMPQGRAPLPEDQITQIQKWIDAGAQNN